MRIEGWECTITPSGDVRAAKHADSGTIVSINGRLMAHADVPREVLLWLIRPLLRDAWDAGCIAGIGCPWPKHPDEAYSRNPYKGEPPNKDEDVS